MIPVTIRFPEELHAALKEFAAEDRRSFNSEIVTLLEEVVAEDRARQAATREFLAQAVGEGDILGADPGIEVGGTYHRPLSEEEKKRP